MLMTPWKSLAREMLLLVQESCLLYIDSDYKSLGYNIYTTIPKHHMQTTLDAIIGKTNQLLSKTMILHTFSTIRHGIDVSRKLSSNLA